MGIPLSGLGGKSHRGPVDMNVHPTLACAFVDNANCFAFRASHTTPIE